MIDIAKLDKTDIDKWVIYKENSNKIPEKGKIKSWNNIFIFIVYKCDNNWQRFQDYTGCATRPEDLFYVENF